MTQPSQTKHKYYYLPSQLISADLPTLTVRIPSDRSQELRQRSTGTTSDNVHRKDVDNDVESMSAHSDVTDLSSAKASVEFLHHFISSSIEVIGGSYSLVCASSDEVMIIAEDIIDGK